MSKLKKIIELRKLIEQNAINKDKALLELQNLINLKTTETNNESEVYLKELHKIKKIRDLKIKLSNKIETLNNDSEDIKSLLSLSDNDLKKIKKIGYELL